MDLRRLRYFVTVAETLNFTAAAHKLSMAQPPLSIQIRNLETQMGGALFDRKQRKIRLTPLGSFLLEEARALIQQADMAEERIRDAAEGRIGQIHVAYTQGALSEKITRRIRKFLRKHRGIRFRTTRVPYENLSSTVSLGFDALITESLESVPDAIILERAAVQIALPPKHRLANRTEVSSSDLIGESFILPPFPERSPIEKNMVEVFEHQLIKINYLDGSPHFSDRMWQVSIGAGISLCTSSDRNELDAVRVALKETPPALIQCLPTPGSRAAALTPFLEAIRE